MTDTQTLLAEYVKNGSEPAFRELVGRYVGLVYCTALRLVGGDTHLAEDVAQIVFSDLARNARNLSKNALLGGWLHRDTCFVASKIMRGERRRQSRERQATEMNALNNTPDAALEEIAPILDEAINQLGEQDRAAILLRFFEQRDLCSVGQAMGITQNAVQKRVSRALEKLHILLKHRGVTLSAGALATSLASGAVAAAPAGLAVSVAGTALATATAGGGTALTIAKIMTMTTLQKTLITATIVAAVGTGLYQAQLAADLRIQVQALQQAPAPPPEQVEQLTRERDDVKRQLASLREGSERSKQNSTELLKLRGEVGTLRRALAEASRQIAGNQTSSVASQRDNQIPPKPVATATTTDLNPVTRMDASFEISQLKDVGNDSVETAAQTALWSVFKRDEQGFDRIRYRDPEAPQMTAKDLQQKLEGLASRFAGATDVTVVYWSKEGDNRRLVHFLAPCPDSIESAYTPEGGTLIFQRVGTGWNLDQFVVQSRGISKTAK